MPFALIFVGILLLVSGVRKTASPPASPNLVTLIQGDFTGKNNFLYWMGAIIAIGLIGYISELKGLSTALLVLVVVVLFLSNGGFFAQFKAAIDGTQTKSPALKTGVAAIPKIPSIFT